MSKLFPQKRCYEIYPLQDLDHSIYQVDAFDFNMYAAIRYAADVINSVATLQTKMSEEFNVEMSRQNFIYVLSAILKDKNSYGGYNLNKVRVCTV